jgi:hypothetical protein
LLGLLVSRDILGIINCNKKDLFLHLNNHLRLN